MKAISQFTDPTNSKNYLSPSAAAVGALGAEASDQFNPFITSYAFFSDFVDVSNSELNKQLRSKDFLQNFKKYFEGIANLNSVQKGIFAYSTLSNLDSVIDQSLSSYNNNLVSTNQTPNKVLAQIGETRILHYPAISSETSVSAKYTIPLLMVYAPINRFHILDLSPNRSIVNKFVSAGFDVFIIDWGQEQSKDKFTLSDYIDNIDQAIELISSITKREKINLFGFSWGGTLSLIYCALHNSKIKNLILQSSNLNFDKDDTIIAEWMRNFPIERFSDEFKEIFGHLIDLAFLMRNPVVHSTDRIKYVLDMREYEIIQFIQNLGKISSWITNTPDISSQMFRQFVIDLYQKNLLFKNELFIEEKEKVKEQREKIPIDLKKITVPILNIVGSKDDLVSPKSSLPIIDSVASRDNKTIEIPLGHIELCISYEAHQNLWPQVVDWLQRKSYAN